MAEWPLFERIRTCPWCHAFDGKDALSTSRRRLQREPDTPTPRFHLTSLKCCAAIVFEDHDAPLPLLLLSSSRFLPSYLTWETWSDTAVQISTSVVRSAELRIGSVTLRGHSPPRLEGEGSSKVTHLLDEVTQHTTSLESYSNLEKQILHTHTYIHSFSTCSPRSLYFSVSTKCVRVQPFRRKYL